MTITQIDNNSKALSSAKSDTFESKSDGVAQPQAESFGQVMSQVQSNKGPIDAKLNAAEASKDPDDAALPGQELAESDQHMPVLFNVHTPTTDTWSLKAVTLGPTLNLITPANAAPDEQSLEAFARSQGLDETAVQWLMSGHTVPSSPTGPMAPQSGQAPGSWAGLEAGLSVTTRPAEILDDSTTANDTTALQETAVQWLMSGRTMHSSPAGPLAPQSGQAPGSWAGLEAGLSITTWSAETLDNSTTANITTALQETAVQWLMSGHTVPSSPTGPMAPQSGQAPGSWASLEAGLSVTTRPAETLADSTTASITTALQGSTNVKVTDAKTGASAALVGGAALWTMVPQAETNPSSPAATDPAVGSAETAEIQIQLLREPTPAAVWMLRNNLNPESAAARRSEKNQPSLSELDLGSDISPEMLDSLMSGLGENAASTTPSASPSHGGIGGIRHDTGNTGQQTGSDTSPPLHENESNAARRSENIQNLAEKMGQAVGQRMLSEIEKGQWHLKLQLRPATLGHIEVEMRMLSGEMDAVFTASQALTRELLQDGMSKLKETLNQMGMNVASMQVGDGQTRQRGGDSTPNKSSKSSDLIENDSKSTISTATWIPKQKMGEDGWDVLV